MDDVDPAADAGVGAQALLGLAAGNSVRLPSLASLSDTRSNCALPTVPPHEVSPLAISSAATHSVDPYPHRSSVSSHEPQGSAKLTRPSSQHENLDLHGEGRAQNDLQKKERSALATVLGDPTSSPADVKNSATTGTPTSTEKANPVFPSAKIPSLSSLVDWGPPPGQATIPSLGMLPSIQQYPLVSHPTMPGPPPLSVPPPQQGDSATQHLWASRTLPLPNASYHPHFHTPSRVQGDWPSFSSVYAYPVGPGPIHTDVQSYSFSSANGGSFLSHGPQLPRLHSSHPVQLPQYHLPPRPSDGTSALRSTLSTELDHRGSQDSYPPVLGHTPAAHMTSSDGAENVADAFGIQRGHSGVSALLAASRPAEADRQSTCSNGSQTRSAKPARKSVFSGPASGRGYIDLMNPAENPTDTLADVAASAEPVLLETSSKRTVDSGERKCSSYPVRSLLDDTKGTSLSRHDAISSSSKITPDIGDHVRTDSVKHYYDEKNEPVSSPLDRSFKIELQLDTKGPTSAKGTLADFARSLNERARSKQSPNENSRTKPKEEVKPTKRTSFSLVSTTSEKSEGASDGVSHQNEKAEDDGPIVDGEEIDKSAESEITRCPCGSTADSGTMIACDQCNTWQHRICMGFRRSSDVPDIYYCNICRPEEMRPNCVAHPKYKERQMAREKDSKNKQVEIEPSVMAVKPVELRKLFIADLKAKRVGAKSTALADLFSRYATLYRAQFGKDRHSMVEGLMVLTEMPRSEVNERFELALKRSRHSSNGSSDVQDILSGHSSERRKSGPMTSDPSSSISGLQSSSTPTPNRSGQKRSRPSSLNLPNDNDTSEQAKASTSNPATPLEKDAHVADGSIAKALSREERKMQQVLNLFAKLEKGQKERKRPRVGELSGSPKAITSSSPRPAVLSTSSRSGLSPKSPSKNLKVSVSPDPVRRTSPSSPKRDRPKNVQPVPSPKQEPSKGNSANGSNGKRERQRGDRKESRRREAKSLGAVAADGEGRRNVVLSRRKENSNIFASFSPSSRAAKSVVAATKKDVETTPKPKIFAPGPSVLGSRLVPRERRSSIDREILDKELEELLQRKLLYGKRSFKKAWLLRDVYSTSRTHLSDFNRRPPKYPIRKRALKSRQTDGLGIDQSPLAGETEKGLAESKHIQVTSSSSAGKSTSDIPGFSVSMVVVSKRDKLPDGGRQLERPRLLEHDPYTRNGTDKTSLSLKQEQLPFTFKKRGYMLNPADESSRKEYVDTLPSKSIDQASSSVESSEPSNLDTSLLRLQALPSKAKGDADTVQGSKNESNNQSRKTPATEVDSDKGVSQESLKRRILRQSLEQPHARDELVLDEETKVNAQVKEEDAEIPAGDGLGNDKDVDAKPKEGKESEVSMASEKCKDSTSQLQASVQKTAAVKHPTQVSKPTLRSISGRGGSPPAFVTLASLSSPKKPVGKAFQPPLLRSAALSWDTHSRKDGKNSPAKEHPTSVGSDSTRQKEASQSLLASEETTASNILQLRLQGFLSQNQSQSVGSKEGSSGGTPSTPSSVNSCPAFSAGLPKSAGVNGVPSAKYNTHSGYNSSWRPNAKSTGPAKRAMLSPGVPSSLSLASSYSAKSSFDRGSSRSATGKHTLPNGKSPHSSLDDGGFATPWRSYRQQNGWAGGSSGTLKHSSFSAAVQPPSAPESTGAIGRRRPYS